MFHRVLLFCASLVFITVPALAEDFVATYQYSDGQVITISTRDAEHVRMDTNPESYMLLKGNKLYAVNKDEDGQWNAMDMDQMKGMSKLSGFLGNKGKTPDYDMKLKYTGKKETIAGFNGKVYDATMLEDGKVIETKELVMCDKPEIQKINDAWVAIASRMSQMSSDDMSRYMEKSNKIAKENNYGGVIRMGEDMKLQSLTRVSLSSSHYELPSNAEMTDIEQPYQDETQEETAGESKAGKVLSQDAKDIGSSAHDEAKQATIDEVKEGVRSIFNGLFK